MSNFSEPLSASFIAKQVASGALTAEAVATHYLTRIQRHDQNVKAFLNVDSDAVLERARDLDKKRSKGQKLGRLAGVPIAVKDNILTKGQKTTAASKILADYVPCYSATVVELLESEDALLLGKTNLDEFAMGSSCENSAFFPTKNPWNLDCVPGGSSGGSAAAVSADLAPLSLGTDTGGSIRQPAAFCGLVGAKPTYGRVSRYGIIAFGSSLDQVGPLARDINDARLCMSVLARHDLRDSTSRNQVWSDQSAETCDLRGKKIAVIKNLSEEGNHASIRKTFEEAVQFLKSKGASVSFVDVKTLQYAMATYYVIAPSEASSNLSRYDGIRYGLRVPGESLDELYHKTRSVGFGAEVKRRIMLGTFALSSGYYDAYFEKARLARKMMTREFENFFESYDFMISPTTPTPAFKIGAKIEDPLAMYLNDICTISANLTGHPALSLPAGFTEENLPIGLHVLGRLGCDETLFAFGKSFEEFFKTGKIPSLFSQVGG